MRQGTGPGTRDSIQSSAASPESKFKKERGEEKERIVQPTLVYSSGKKEQTALVQSGRESPFISLPRSRRNRKERE